MPQEIQLFADKQIRTYWDDDKELYFFCIIDVVEALTDSNDPKQYIKRMRQRDPGLNSVWGTICTPHQFLSSDGKRHQANCASLGGVLRIQQSLADFKRLGYSDNWINQRLKSIEIRKDLTDQWKAHGVDEGTGYATLTDIIYQSWAGLTAKKYKQLKGLRKENLRDHMTNEELVMNMLAELTTTNITKEEHPISMSEHAQAASRGGSVARVAREAFEQQTGKKVVTNLNMKRFLEKQQPQLDFSGDSEDKDK